MENELNYLSEKIEALTWKIDLYSGKINSTQLGKSYAKMVKDHKEEKQLLENILNALTINELK